MQRFKPLLPLNGAPVIEHVIRNFRNAGIDDIATVAGYNAEELRHGVEGLGVRVVFNSRFAEGMYSSVVAGIGALAEEVEGCLLIPADMPLVRSSTVTYLCRAFGSTGAAVVYPTFEKRRGHPTLISSRLFPAILSGDGTGGLRALLAAHDSEAHEEPVADEGILIDLDTPADYAKAQQRAGQLDLPTPNECEAILDEMQVFPNIVSHCRRVAEVAEKLSIQLNAAGLHLNLNLVKASALLHDLAKGKPDHARAGGQILQEMGFAEVGRVVGLHMDCDFQEGGAVDEAAVVYLVDKMVQGNRIVSLSERFQRAFAAARGNGTLPFVRKRWEMAQSIAGAVERILGADIQRFISPQSNVQDAMVGDATTH
jgi:CTP:molybdopterin cytidylyltransferase MocA